MKAAGFCFFVSELGSCVKVEVTVLGSRLSLTAPTVSVDVEQR